MKNTFLAAALLAAGSSAWAQDSPEPAPDRVALINGMGLSGRILSVTEDEVVIRVGRAVVGFRRDLVAWIERPSAPPEPPPPVAAPPEPAAPDRPPPPPAPAADRSPRLDAEFKARIDGLLARLKEEDPAGRQALVQELAQTGGSGQAYLTSKLEEDPEIADAVLTAIVLNPSSDGLPILAGQMERIPDAIRSRVMIALGNRRYKEAADVVSGQLKSADRDVQIAAVNALSAIGGPAHAELLLDLMASADRAVADRVIEALTALQREYGDPVHARTTTRAILLCQSVGSRPKTNGALLAARLKLFELVPTLLQLLYDRDVEARAASVAALGEMEDPRAVDPLCKRIVLEEDRRTKIQIVQALAAVLKGTKDYRPIRGLIRLLRDPDPEVRERAAIALLKITGEPLGQDAEAWEAWQKKRFGGN